MDCRIHYLLKTRDTFTCMCRKKASCTITARTARMHIAATTANLFHLNSGSWSNRKVKNHQGFNLFTKIKFSFNYKAMHAIILVFINMNQWTIKEEEILEWWTRKIYYCLNWKSSNRSLFIENLKDRPVQIIKKWLSCHLRPTCNEHFLKRVRL